MSTADGYPTLCCKAFNGRLLLVFLDICVHTLTNNSRPDAELYNLCIASRSLRAWFDLVERAPRFLSQSQRVELYSLGQKFVKSLDRLAFIALMAGSSRWRLQPKLHAYIHLNEDHLHYGMNCRFYHCYLDEDHIGLTKRLTQKVHRGDLLEFRVLCRWLLRLGSWGSSWKPQHSSMLS